MKKYFKIIAVLLICSICAGIIQPASVNAATKAVSKDFVINNGVLTKYKGDSKKVTIPNTVTSIGQSAFRDNDKITSVTIPKSVKVIGVNAFKDCDNLATITIPASVKDIDRGAFSGTKWLSKQQKKNALVVVNGILIDGTKSTGKVTIPKTVTSIGDSAFYGCTKVTSITIPDSVTTIKDRAFYGCSKLKTITIPASVKNIGDRVFVKCDNLTIIGSSGSYAQTLAKKLGIPFQVNKSDSTSGNDNDENKTEPTTKPDNSPSANTGSPSGNYGGGSNRYRVDFYDGDRLVDTLYVPIGQALSTLPTAEKTAKGDSIFVGWFTDKALTQPFYSDSVVKGSMSVYGKYTDLQSETLNITSFAQLDQSPDMSFTVVRAAGSTIDPANAFTLVTKDGSDTVPLRWEEISSGTYTVFAESGFNKGSSYELTLADGYSFKDKPDTIRTASFSIAMEAVDNLKMSDEIVYIQDTAAIQYTIPGQDSPVDVLTPSLVPDTGGEFTYEEAGSLVVGDILCFYITTNPKDRDYINHSYNDDPEVYAEVESISGTIVKFGDLDDEDMEALYEVPDNLPVIVDELPTGDTGTINISRLDLETYATMLGVEDGTLENAKAKVNVGDFISLYTAAYKSAQLGEGSLTDENTVYYGEVTAYNSASGDITYKRTTEEAIENAMNLYITPEVSGDDLITPEEKAVIEAQLLEQVQASNFAEDAAYLLADMATKTDGFRSAKGVQEFLISDENGNTLSEDEIALLNLGASFELSDDIKLTVEIITKGDQLHFSDGVQLAIGIDATFEVDTADEGKVAIDLSASFVEEVALGINVKGELVKKRILGIPIPIGVKVSSAIDVKNYTAVAFNVNIYTVAPEEKSTWDKLKGLMKDTKIGEVIDKIEEVQSKIDQAKDSAEQIQGYIKDVENMWKSITTKENDPKAWMETLEKTNITKDLMEMLDISTETGIQSGKYAESMEELMQKYSDMLQKETDWIELINKEIFSIEQCYFGIAVAISANFVVSADLNLAMGSSLEYEVGKRYSFWFKIGLFKPTAGSSTMDLVDERFAFQFYVMGKVGLKMGVRAKLKTGIGSTKLASIGFYAELGPYVKLYGFFLYEYEKMRPANTNRWTYDERKAGALFVEFGAYFMLGLEATALSTFEVSYDIVDVEIPLLTAGEKRYRYAFEYEPQEGEKVRIVDENSDSRDGITMTLPDSLRAVSYVDLDTGILGSEYYDYSKYNITLSNPNFSLDQNGKVTVNVPEGVQYMECDLTFTWLYNKLAFSEYDMTVTIPLVWTNLSYKELNEYFTASVRVGNASEGYQTVWSKRVRKNQPYNLPTTEEIKKLINYDSFDNGSGTNMKYSNLTGYKTQATKNLKIYTDTVYDFDVTLRDFTLTVNGIQNSDGSISSKPYTVKYGKTFDFSDLTGTGKNIENTDYTKFANVTTDATISVVGKDGQTINQVIDLTQPVTGKIAVALADGNKTATANYVDDSVVATFQFVGVDHEVITQRLKKNSIPDITLIDQIVEEAGAMIQEISPTIGKQTINVNYIVYCSKQTSGIKTTISFEENGGSQVSNITKVVGSIIGALPVPVKTGYTFDGWYTNNMLTEQFTQTKVPETDITLYAKWTPNTYTVTLHANGGAFEGETNTTNITVTYGSSYGALPTPIKTGEIFAGWYTASEGGIRVSTVTIAQDHTLYAHWSDKLVILDSIMTLDGITSLEYDGMPKVVTVTSGSAIAVSGGAISAASGSAISSDIFTIQYRRSDADEWSDTAINAGLYSVKVSLDTSIYPEYAPFEKTFNDVMTIAKIPSSFLLTTPQLTGTVFGKGNIVVQKLIKGTDYIGDGIIEYAAVKSDGGYLSDPNTWNWHNSNIIYNADNNSGVDGEYVLAARLREGENYLASELICYEIDGSAWKSIVDTTPIEAGVPYKLDSTNGYHYAIKVKTSDIKNAGTDSNIYAGLGSSYEPVTNSSNWSGFLLDSKANDFERNSLGIYALKTVGDTTMQPMHLQLVYDRKGLINEGWHCAWMEVDLYKRTKLLQTSERINVNKWFEAWFATESYNATIQFKRRITGANGFDNASDLINLIESDHSGTYDFTFDGTVYDQFRPEGYNSYDFQFTPELSIVANGYEDCISRTENSISIDKDKLYNKMVAKDSHSLEFTINLTFNDNVTTDDTKVFSKTIRITR